MYRQMKASPFLKIFFEKNIRASTELDTDAMKTYRKLPLLEYAHVCVGLDNSTVLATRLEDHVKIFTLRDAESYLQGEPGDWLVARSHDDIYIVTADVFEKLYIRDCTD